MKKIQNISILSDSFIPSKISAAGMILNLGNDLKNKNYQVTFIYGGYNPNSNQDKTLFENYSLKGFNFISSKFLISIRSKGNIQRFIYEIILSLMLSLKILINLKKLKKTDLIIWYGPSAFLWLPCWLLKLFSSSPVYYILRDIFPDWLIDLGLIKNKLLFSFLKLISYPQYLIPDTIGVESDFNLNFLKAKKKLCNIEVLFNWPSLKYNQHNTQYENYLKDFKKNKLMGVYIGNNSSAHDFDRSRQFYLKNQFKNDLNLNINLFVNKTSKVTSINKVNEIYYDQINHFILPSIMHHFNFGIVSLNNNLITQNIPGKFVTYLQFNLPVLAFSHKGSTISSLILQNDCGINIDLNDENKLNVKKLEEFLTKLLSNYYRNQSRFLFNKKFSIEKVTKQILEKF